MPSYEQHIMQAEHNEDMLRFIGSHNKQTCFSDWYVTTAFYAGVHFFEAVIASTKLTVPAGVGGGFKITVEHTSEICGYWKIFSEHYIRNKVMKAQYKQLHFQFASLYEMSRTARYGCHAPNSHDWHQAEIYLSAVKEECEKVIRKKK
jgi:hypothetical protein